MTGSNATLLPMHQISCGSLTLLTSKPKQVGIIRRLSLTYSNVPLSVGKSPTAWILSLLVLDALNQALDSRGRPNGVIHHSGKGSQYLSIKYGDRLKAFELMASVGTTGDSYDNALAESVNGLYKTEVIHYFKEHWDGVNDVALAALDWVHWYNHERLHSSNGYLSPLKAEINYYSSLNG